MKKALDNRIIVCYKYAISFVWFAKLTTNHAEPYLRRVKMDLLGVKNRKGGDVNCIKPCGF